MWTRGSAALGDLGNSFIGLVDNTNNGKKCVPDLITYSTIINGLCKVGRLDEAKKKFVEMKAKNVSPDSVIYETFIHGFCNQGKISSAFRVLRDMEKKGCKPCTQTYNSLISGLSSEQKTDAIYNLMKEMEMKGISPDVFTYNNLISSLCEGGKATDATSVLDKMLKNHVFPNVSSFKLLISALCKTRYYREAQEVFDIGLSICGHKEALYGLIVNELLAGRELSEAKGILESAIDRGFDVEVFSYRDLIKEFCKEDKFEEAREILDKLIDKGCDFDPASFIPVIDGLGKEGNKHEAGELAKTMMGMDSEGRKERKLYQKGFSEKKLNLKKLNKDGYGENQWHTVLHRDDGSGLAVRVLKQVQKGWGQAYQMCNHRRKNFLTTGRILNH
ncbi:hypothetical protein MKX01_034457 [Papaver californicum]|nr:hypothetical protein MKX01_034457 [Papaver californicum]